MERYTPYGEPSDMQLDAGPGFTGHATDVQTGLIYMQQRYYDAEIGRFISPDPQLPDANTGANINRYWYADNNPIKNVDPDGRQSYGYGMNQPEDGIKGCDQTGSCVAPQQVNFDSDSRAFMSVVMIGPTLATGGYYLRALGSAGAAYYSRNSKQVNEVAYRMFCAISSCYQKGDDGFPDLKKEMPDQIVEHALAKRSVGAEARNAIVDGTKTTIPKPGSGSNNVASSGNKVSSQSSGVTIQRVDKSDRMIRHESTRPKKDP